MWRGAVEGARDAEVVEVAQQEGRSGKGGRHTELYGCTGGHQGEV